MGKKRKLKKKKNHTVRCMYVLLLQRWWWERLGRGSRSCWSDLDLGALIFPEPVPALMGFTLQVVKIQLSKKD